MSNGSLPVASSNGEVIKRKKNRKHRKIDVVENGVVSEQKLDGQEKKFEKHGDARISPGKAAWQDESVVDCVAVPDNKINKRGIAEENIRDVKSLSPRKINGSVGVRKLEDDNVMTLDGSREHLATLSPANRSSDMDSKRQGRSKSTKKAKRGNASPDGTYDNAALDCDDEISGKTNADPSPTRRESPYKKNVAVNKKAVDNEEILKIDIEQERGENSCEMPKTNARPERVILNNLGDQIVNSATLFRIRSTLDRPVNNVNDYLTQLQTQMKSSVEDLE